MTSEDNQPDGTTSSSTNTSSQQTDRRLSSKQAGQTLRWLAEDIFLRKGGLSHESVQGLSLEEVKLLLHELRVHQIELEIQNEELRRTHAEMEATKDRYFDLYDLAPVGYLTVSEKGLILEANLTVATQLGVDRNLLIDKPLTSFIVTEDQDIYYQHRRLLFKTETPQTCELRLLRKDSPPLWTLLKAIIAEDGEKGNPVCRVVVTDIHERKQAEERLRIAYAELEVRVQERTSQLSEANSALSVEMAECKQQKEDFRECQNSVASSKDNS